MKSFKTPRKTIGDLDADTVARLLTASSDIALVIDKKGVIRDIAYEDESLSREGCTNWLGRPWIETVTIESRAKVEDMLHEAVTDGQPRWRQVNHPTGHGADLPVRYTALRLNGDSRIMALGRDLRSFAAMQQEIIQAQFQVEREMARARSLEARYRSLFHLSSEAIVIVDATSMRVTEANPASMQLLANGSRRVANRLLLDLVDPDSVGAVQNLLSLARGSSRAETTLVGLKHGQRFNMQASLFRIEGSVFFLIRLTPVNAAAEAQASNPLASKVLEVMQAMPDAFVVIDADRRILVANASFADYVQLGSSEQARGEFIDRWLGRAGVDTDVLFANLREQGAVRRFNTVLRGDYGMAGVEVSAVSVPGAEPPCYGLTIRRVEREIVTPSIKDFGLPRSADQLTELVGRVPLKDLVRETTDIIERMCIEAALNLTGDNRASAAEMLGLSRQGLYMKLRRYGLGELDDSQQG